jgi:hypothetical protein
MPSALPRLTERALRWTSRGLVGVTWLSAGTFGVYILAHYGGALPAGKPLEWNQTLPGIYDASTPLATLGIALHFATGGVLLALGPLQLFQGLRARWPAFHRWAGRVYVAAALGAGVGGLVFIAVRGTVGGLPMSVGFALYGIAIVAAAAQAVRHARARRFDLHRAWAIRLSALVIGSWLYRMDYGFWLLLDRPGHTPTFDGSFDHVMDFFFYIPNLLVAELFIRASGRAPGPRAQAVASAALAAGTAFLALATYFFVRYSWAPAIVARFS